MTATINANIEKHIEPLRKIFGSSENGLVSAQAIKDVLEFEGKGTNKERYTWGNVIYRLIQGRVIAKTAQYESVKGNKNFLYQFVYDDKKEDAVKSSEPPFIAFDPTLNKFVSAISEKELDEKIKDLMAQGGHRNKIVVYKAYEVIDVQRRSLKG